MPLVLPDDPDDFDPAQVDDLLRWVARYIEVDEPTSYTRDQTYDALANCHVAIEVKRIAAAVIRDRDGQRRRLRRFVRL